MLNTLFLKIKKDRLDRYESYVFAEAIYDPEYDEKAEFYVFAMPAEGAPSRNNGAYESGGCPQCKTTVHCTAKLAICPVCGYSAIECT